MRTSLVRKKDPRVVAVYAAVTPFALFGLVLILLSAFAGTDSVPEPSTATTTPTTPTGSAHQDSPSDSAESGTGSVSGEAPESPVRDDDGAPPDAVDPREPEPEPEPEVVVDPEPEPEPELEEDGGRVEVNGDTSVPDVPDEVAPSGPSLPLEV